MSDPKDEKKHFADFMANNAELEKLKNETSAKKIRLEAKRVNAQMEKLKEDERDEEILKNTSYDRLTDEEIEKLIEDNNAYMDAARNPLIFLNIDFRGVVPFFRKNLIAIFGKTGEGKSTAVANIVHSILSQKVGDRYTRSMVLSNEEKAEDVYNRVACHLMGWEYSDHDKFTDEQRVVFNQVMRYLASSGRLTVISDDHKGTTGATTTIEGVRNILNGLLKNRVYYDAIFIDYYQKIDSSKDNPMLKEHEVQSKLTTYLDTFKNIYPAPIVVMAQIRPQPDKSDTPAEYRIKGSKSLLVKATCALEIIKQGELSRTAWVLLKGRFTKYLGEVKYTGFDKGKFVLYNNEFRANAAKVQEAKKLSSFDLENGIRSEDK